MKESTKRTIANCWRTANEMAVAILFCYGAGIVVTDLNDKIERLKKENVNVLKEKNIAEISEIKARFARIKEERDYYLDAWMNAKEEIELYEKGLKKPNKTEE
jgi:hypothetical protein